VEEIERAWSRGHGVFEKGGGAGRERIGSRIVEKIHIGYTKIYLGAEDKGKTKEKREKTKTKMGMTGDDLKN